jgi:hypothetical protein
MHGFCYPCLYDWLANGRKACSFCGEILLEAPIRDDALELELADAIENGLVIQSEYQKGKQVAGKEEEYTWEGIEFGET